MDRWIGDKRFELTERNGGFPSLGHYRVFPKESFTDEVGFWELVRRRTRRFEFNDLFAVGRVKVWGFENLDLDGLELDRRCFEGYTQLKSELKFLGYPSCIALEMYCAYHKEHI